MDPQHVNLTAFTQGDFVRRTLKWTHRVPVDEDDPDGPYTIAVTNLADRTFQSQIRYNPSAVDFWEWDIAKDDALGLTVLTMDDPVTAEMPAGNLYWDLKEIIVASEPLVVVSGRVLVRPRVTR